ncbi:hypothetical protein GF420_14020 [candidate division GN15 bacterium]|nr:hypothetical protein [candidate division GN15 bacterium]
MKQYAKWIVVLAFVLSSSALASSVTDIELRHEVDGVAAYIAVDGTVRFIHQVEPPKDGKPHRVIVDVLSATHALGKRNFVTLPDGCSIASIRTSQYAVQPEKIVRIVFDMQAAPVYSVTAENGAVKVFFTDKTANAFAAWSSKDYVSSVTGSSAPAPNKPAQTSTTSTTDKANKKIQDDRLASLSDKPTPAKQGPAKPAVTKPKRPTVTPSTTSTKQPTVSKPAQPKSALADASDKAADAKTNTVDRPSQKVHADTTPPASLTATEPSVTKPSASARPKAESTKPTQQALAEKIANSKNPAKPAAPAEPKQPTVAKSDNAGEPAKTPAKPAVKATPKKPAAQTAQKQSSDNSSKTVAKVDKSNKSTPPPTRTSRFRRAPTTPSKLKGTMVAEFPKRLVIKYKATRHRDPFATLINDTKTNDNPVERRVPNVEGLRLVGIIEAVDGANRALFEDKDGYSYILKSGDKVRKGYVLRVERDRVYFQIFEYGWSRTVALQIEE